MNALGLRIQGSNTKVSTLAGMALLLLAVAGPARAQYGYGGQQGYYGGQQGYYGQGNSAYYQGYQSSTPATSSWYNPGGFLDGAKNWFEQTFAGNGSGQGLGRTLGGAAGIAAGSFGGAALASAVIKSAGVAAMGPIAPILVGTAITAGGAFLGGKILPHGG